MKYSPFLLVLFASFRCQAEFYIDYQGLDKKEVTAAQKRKINETPDGYRLLTDEFRGVVHEIGSGKQTKNTSFGADEALKNALAMIVPSNWVVYADEHFTDIPDVTWEATDELWLVVLSRIGSNHGIRYVVDWDQEVIQVSKDEDFVQPDFNAPTVLEHPTTGKRIFIYTEDKLPTQPSKGFIVVDGELIKVEVKS